MDKTIKTIKNLVKNPSPLIDMVNETIEKNKDNLKKTVDTIETTYSEKVLEIVTKDEAKVKLRKRKSKRSKKPEAPKNKPATEETSETASTEEKTTNLISSDSEEEIETAKPLFYPHSFNAQASELDVTLNENKNVSFLELLKFKEFEGLYHLAFIYLVYSIILLIWNNIEKRGILISFEFFTCPDNFRGMGITVLLVLANVIYSYLFFFLQCLRSHHNLNTVIYFTTYSLLQLVNLFVFTGLVLEARLTPFVAAVAMMMLVCLLLKQHSFIFTNYAFERNNQGENKVDIPLSKSHYLYFLACPTLVYELSYPKTEKIRISYLLKMTGQAIGAFFICFFILQQFITPYLSDLSLSPLERILSAAIPAFCCWLAGFYMLFHCLLNILAEVLMFADRQFYTDWWNTTDIAAFWRTWNQPIHVWCLRHVYVESQVYGNLDKKKAGLMTFVFSGIMHELIMCVMFRCVTPYFLLGMAVQFPMGLISGHIKSKLVGNMVMWLSLFFGQPFLEMSYANVWFSHHSSWFCGPV